MKKKLGFLFICLFISNIYAQKAGKCLYFDNSGGYIACPNTENIKPTKEITIEAWVRFDHLFNWSTVLSCAQDNRNEESGYCISYYNNKVRFLVKTDNGFSDDWYNNPGASVQEGKWHHIAGTYDGTTIRFYLDGVQTEHRDVSGNIVWKYKPIALSVGAFIDNNDHLPFNGCIDEVRIWNVARTGKEIRENMSRPLTGNENDLLLYYDFNDNAEEIRDLTGNGSQAKLVNMSGDFRVASFAMESPDIMGYEKKDHESIILHWDWKSDVAASAFYLDISQDKHFTRILPEYKKKKIDDIDSLIVQGLSPGQIYYCRLSAFNESMGYSANSNTIEVRDFMTAMNVRVRNKALFDKNGKQLVSDGKLIHSEIQLPYNKNSIRFDISQSSYYVTHKDSFRYMLEGVDEDWEVISNNDAIVQYNSISSGQYKFLIQNKTKGKWYTSNFIAVKVSSSLLVYWWLYIGIVVIVGIIIIFVNKEFELSIKRKEHVPSNKNIVKLTALMDEEKMFCNSELSQQSLADALELSKPELVELIKYKYKLKFNEFINKYRVQEVKRLLNDPEYKNYTMIAVAHQCGFNSESSFYRIFKNETGMTPMHYMEKIRK